MNASITTPRLRSTPRSPRSTTGSDPALDRSVGGGGGQKKKLAHECHRCDYSPHYDDCIFPQGSESEEEEYHKKKKRSASKTPSERSSSGESGESPRKSRASPPICAHLSLFTFDPREKLQEVQEAQEEGQEETTQVCKSTHTHALKTMDSLAITPLFFKLPHKCFVIVT